MLVSKTSDSKPQRGRIRIIVTGKSRNYQPFQLADTNFNKTNKTVKTTMKVKSTGHK